MPKARMRHACVSCQAHAQVPTYGHVLAKLWRKCQHVGMCWPSSGASVNMGACAGAGLAGRPQPQAHTGGRRQRGAVWPELGAWGIHLWPDPGCLGPLGRGTSRPSTPPGNPLTDNPVTGNPLTGKPLTGNPLTGQPLTGDPLTGNPLTGKPLTGTPLTGQPLTGNLLTGDPLTGDLLTRNPLTGNPLTGNLSTGDSTELTAILVGVDVMPGGQVKGDLKGLANACRHPVPPANTTICDSIMLKAALALDAG